MTSSKTIKDICKEYRFIKKHSKSHFDDQANISFTVGPKNPFKISVTLMPNFGFFKDAKVLFHIELPSNYPNDRPKIICKNKIFHPNINFSGSLCFTMLSNNYDVLKNKENNYKGYSISHMINGLLFLLNNPNHSSPLNSTCVRKDDNEFIGCVKLALCGNEVSGIKYDFCINEESLDFSDMLLLSMIVKVRKFDEKGFEYISKNYKLKGTMKTYFDIMKNLYTRGFNDLNCIGMIKMKRAATRISSRRDLLSKVTYSDLDFAKEMIMCVDEKKFILVLSNGLNHINLEEMKESLKCKSVRLATFMEMKDVLAPFSYESIPFFYYMQNSGSNLCVYFHNSIFRRKNILLSSGTNTVLYKVNTKKLKGLVDKNRILKMKNHENINVSSFGKPMKNWGFFFTQKLVNELEERDI